MKQVVELYSKNANIECQIFSESRDFSMLEFEEYLPNMMGITHAHIQAETNDIYKRWEHEVDLVIFLVHDDNWIVRDKVWGWNISKIFNGYEIEQCRFDPKNEANTVGTLYHEIMHSHDSFIYRLTGIRIEELVKVNNWDYELVHGESTQWDYIRYKENQSALTLIASPLKKAVDVKVALFEARVKSLYRQLYDTLEILKITLRTLSKELEKRDMPILSKGRCECIK